MTTRKGIGTVITEYTGQYNHYFRPKDIVSFSGTISFEKTYHELSR